MNLLQLGHQQARGLNLFLICIQKTNNTNDCCIGCIRAEFNDVCDNYAVVVQNLTFGYSRTSSLLNNICLQIKKEFIYFVFLINKFVLKPFNCL